MPLPDNIKLLQVHVHSIPLHEMATKHSAVGLPPIKTAARHKGFLKVHFIHFTTRKASLGDLEDGVLLEDMLDCDATSGHVQVTKRPYRSEDGGPLKMMVTRLSQHHDKEGTLKLLRNRNPTAEAMPKWI